MRTSTSTVSSTKDSVLELAYDHCRQIRGSQRDERLFLIFATHLVVQSHFDGADSRSKSLDSEELGEQHYF